MKSLMSLIFVLLALSLWSCGVSLNAPVNLVSNCRLHSEPSASLFLEPDQTFKYKLAYIDTIEGTWKLHGDTIELTSTVFEISSIDDMTPSLKRSNFSDRKEVYLIQGKKLFALENNGVVDECFLLLK